MPKTKAITITLALRDLYHFLIASGGSYAALWIAAGKPTNKEGLTALIPGVATVLFRQVFPNAGKPAPKAPSNGGVAS